MAKDYVWVIECFENGEWVVDYHSFLDVQSREDAREITRVFKKAHDGDTKKEYRIVRYKREKND